MDLELLGKNIKELCLKSGINISQLEKELHFSVGLIGKWKTSAPSIEKVMLVAEYFHISLDELCGKKKSEEEKKFMENLIRKTREGSIEWCPCPFAEFQKLKIFYKPKENDSIEIYVSDYRQGTFCFVIEEESRELYISLNAKGYMKQKEDMEQLQILWKEIKEKEQMVQAEIEQFKQDFCSGN